jgi:hypothetical protein
MTVRVRLRRHLDSDTIRIPELKELIGKDVEIDLTVSEADSAPAVRDFRPLKGSVLKYEDPYGPAVDPDDWEANR